MLTIFCGTHNCWLALPVDVLGVHMKASLTESTTYSKTHDWCKCSFLWAEMHHFSVKLLNYFWTDLLGGSIWNFQLKAHCMLTALFYQIPTYSSCVAVGWVSFWITLPSSCERGAQRFHWWENKYFNVCDVFIFVNIFQ